MKNEVNKSNKCSQNNQYYVVLALVVSLVFGAIILFIIGVKEAPDYNQQLQESYATELKLRNNVLKDDSLRRYAQLDTLFAQWQTIMKQEQVVQKASNASAEQNVAIWLAVIAAICTMLPIVIGMNQNMNFNRELDSIKSDYDEKSNEMECKIQEMEDNISDKTQEMSSGMKDEMKSLQEELTEYIQKQTKDNQENLIALNKTTGIVRLLSIINSLAVNVRILGELEDLEIKQSVVLTCPNLLKRQLERMVLYCDKCEDDFHELTKTQNLNNDDYKLIADDGLGVLVMMHNLMKKYETKMVGAALFLLQDIMDNIWKRIHMNVDSSDTEFSKVAETVLIEASKYAPMVKDLFLKEFVEVHG